MAALEKCPTTIDTFCFWTDKDTLLNPFDVVVVDHVNGSKTYGVVEEISHITDSESFLAEYFSNDFGDIESTSFTDRVGMNYVSAKVVGNTKNIFIPVHNGAKVSLGTKADIQEALGLNDIKNPVVCGYLEMYSGVEDAKIDLPVYINSDFLIGPEGAHLNISGISGLATYNIGSFHSDLTRLTANGRRAFPTWRRFLQSLQSMFDFFLLRHHLPMYSPDFENNQLVYLLTDSDCYILHDKTPFRAIMPRLKVPRTACMTGFSNKNSQIFNSIFNLFS